MIAIMIDLKNAKMEDFRIVTCSTYGRLPPKGRKNGGIYGESKEGEQCGDNTHATTPSS